MTGYLLMNIISDVTKPAPSPELLASMGRFTMTYLSLRKFGADCVEKPARKKRASLEAWFAGPEGPQTLFAGRVLPFDEKAALVWARLMAEGTAKGRPRSALDMIVAAVAEANGCVVVTDNEKDFAGLKFVNPLRAARAR